MRSIRPHEMSTPLSHAWSRTEAARNAQAVLSGELGVLEGCISLASLAHDIIPNWSDDPDFVVFAAISSKVDHLPFGHVRDQWSAASLARADREIERITRDTREVVLVACRHILERFGAPELEAK